MKPDTETAGRSLVLRILYFVLVTALLLAFFGDWTYDDPFITYRYAANIADGLGFVYNPGERVLSTTSPLLATVLAGAGLAGIDIPAAANLLGAVGLAAGGLLFVEIGRRHALPALGWTGAALYPTSILIVGTLGSEIPIYLALCLAVFAAYWRQRYVLAAVLLGLAVLARADAVIVGGVISIDWLARTWRAERSLGATLRAIPWKAVLAGAAVLAPWIIFGFAYFGSPLPATLAAKQAQGRMIPGELFIHGLQELTANLLAIPHYPLLFGLIAAGWAAAIRKQREFLPLLAWPLFFGTGYVLLGVTRYQWYYAPLAPGAIAAAGLAIAWLIGPLTSDRESGGTEAIRGRHWRLLAGLLVLVFLFAGQLADLARLHGAADNRYRIYRNVGSWLAAHTEPDASIATSEVGIIGFFARPRPVIDFSGLIQPEIAARFGPGYSYSEGAIWAAERYQPDIFVLTAGHHLRLQRGYLDGRCDLAAEFRGDFFAFDEIILVYVCG